MLIVLMEDNKVPAIPLVFNFQQSYLSNCSYGDSFQAIAGKQIWIGTCTVKF